MLISKFNNEHNDKNINIFEDKFKIKIPEEYRNFLIKYNGGKTPNTKFKSNKIFSDLMGFYGFGKAEKELNYRELEQLEVINDYLNDHMMPIGSNVFGDKITIGLKGFNKGKLFFLYHDRPQNYVKIAENFHEFVELCKSQKIGYIPSIEERKQKMIEKGSGDKITEFSIKGWQAEIDEYKNIIQEVLIL